MNVALITAFLLNEDGLMKVDGKCVGERTSEFIINRCRWLVGPKAKVQSDGEILTKVHKHLHYVKTTKRIRKKRE